MTILVQQIDNNTLRNHFNASVSSYLIKKVSEDVLVYFGASDMFSEPFEDATDNEDVIEDGQAHEKSVEYAGHLLAQENRNGDRVPDETQTTQRYLQRKKVRIFCKNISKEVK